MTDLSNHDLLNQAEQAFLNNDRRKGFINIILVFKNDFTNDRAWRLLHQVMKSTKPFEVFQLEFAQKNYPDKVHLLTEKEFSNLVQSAKKVETQPLQEEKQINQTQSVDPPSPNYGYCPQCGKGRLAKEIKCLNCGYPFQSDFTQNAAPGFSSIGTNSHHYQPPNQTSQVSNAFKGSNYQYPPTQQDPPPIANNGAYGLKKRYKLKWWLIILFFAVIFLMAFAIVIIPLLLPRLEIIQWGNKKIDFRALFIFISSNLSFIVFGFWAIKGIIGGVIILNKKFRGSTWVWVLIIPIFIPLAYLALMAIGGEFTYAAARNMEYSYKKCPHCQSWISFYANRCPHCGQPIM